MVRIEIEGLPKKDRTQRIKEIAGKLDEIQIPYTYVYIGLCNKPEQESLDINVPITDEQMTQIMGW